MNKPLLLLLLPILFSQKADAQADGGGSLKGKLINAESKMPLYDTKVTLPQFNQSVVTDAEGSFVFEHLPTGIQRVVVGQSGATKDTTIMVNGMVDMGEWQVNLPVAEAHEHGVIHTVNIEDNNSANTDDGGQGAQTTGGYFNAAQDPFYFTASFVLGLYRFRPRGLNNGPEVMVNGFPIQDLETGFSSWNQIGGLNDVLRSRNVTYGIKPSDYTFGENAGSIYIDATAADQRKGTNVSISETNGLFRHRVMLTHSTGIMKNGWAFTFSGSRRWAKEGYEQGTFYDGYSIYAGASKMLKKGSINITAIAAPTVRGRAAAAVAELNTLSGSNYYNPSWGYQNGVKRNSNISDISQPIIMANYIYKPNEKTNINTTVGFEFGKNKRTGIDWYNGANPFPDYYRNLPSYYRTFTFPDNTTADALEAYLKSHPEALQIDWDGMIAGNRVNKETIYNVDGNGTSATGLRSIYVVSSTVDDKRKYVFNTNIQHIQTDNLTLFGGLRYVNQVDEYYRQVEDLLGGDFFVNYNQFAVQSGVSTGNTLNQNDLDNPNRLIKVGDKYGNNYKLHIMESTAWGQATYTKNSIDAFAALQVGYTSFYREGLMRNGLFPNNSLGKSDAVNFLTYSAKGGGTYKISARHALFASMSYNVEAPKVDFTYISSRTRDFTIDNPETQKTIGVEAGYLYKGSVVTAKALGYIYETKDAVIMKRFFNDDPSIQSFVNYAMQNVGTRSLGAEFSANVKLNKLLSLTGVASLGQAFYSTRPTVSSYTDNDAQQKVVAREVYIQNYYLSMGPQSVGSLALNYRPRSWRTAVVFNYTDRNFVDVNPDRRTQAAADLVTPNSTQWNKIYDQERLPSAFTMDINGGRSFDLNRYVKALKHKTSMFLNVSIRNVLNNTNIKVAGFEQLRFDYSGKNAERFPNKYDYAFGTTYYINLSFRF